MCTRSYACMYMHVYVCLCVDIHVCTCVWKQAVYRRYLSLSLSSLYFETGTLTEPGANCSGWHRILLSSHPLPKARVRSIFEYTSFFWSSRNPVQVLKLPFFIALPSSCHLFASLIHHVSLVIQHIRTFCSYLWLGHIPSAVLFPCPASPLSSSWKLILLAASIRSVFI